MTPTKPTHDSHFGISDHAESNCSDFTAKICMCVCVCVCLRHTEESCGWLSEEWSRLYEGSGSTYLMFFKGSQLSDFFNSSKLSGVHSYCMLSLTVVLCEIPTWGLKWGILWDVGNHLLKQPGHAEVGYTKISNTPPHGTSNADVRGIWSRVCWHIYFTCICVLYLCVSLFNRIISWLLDELS